MDKVNRFNKFEKIFFRTYLSIFALGMFLLMTAYAAVDSIESIARTFVNIVYILFYILIINFIISIIRLLKYLISFRNSKVMPTIKRTIIIILTSPIALGLYFILTLIMSLSLASCTY